MSKDDDEITPEQLSGYVTCLYDQKWWVAYVLEVYADKAQVKVSFLHPHGPSRSFKHPHAQDILTIAIAEVLTLVDVRTTTGRVYTLTKKESQLASQKFEQYC